jgi:golgi SNAP receptor complex member 2
VALEESSKLLFLSHDKYKQLDCQMTSIHELFPKCRKLAYDARQALQQQQQSDNVLMILEELTVQLQCMETLVTKEIPSQRLIWQRKISELRQESQLLHRQQQSLPSQRSTYASQREELMQMRQRRSNKSATENDLQNLSKESQSIHSSHTMVLDILQSGEASYHELRQQRKQLSSISSLMSNIDSTLGLSRMTMQIIERRDITDAYYVLAGMLITCIVLYVTWFM